MELAIAVDARRDPSRETELRQRGAQFRQADAPWLPFAIADQRVSAEGQEGLRAFLEKRTPSWQA